MSSTLKSILPTALGVLFLLSIPVGAQDTITGKWSWSGDRGWQRITLDLTAKGNRLTGTITLGPGSSVRTGQEADWEYFFEPAVFQIENGIIAGDTFSFEQTLLPVLEQRGSSRHYLKYTGKVQGDRILFVREGAALPADPTVLGTHRFQFAANRGGKPTPAPVQIKAVDMNFQASAPVPIDIEVSDASRQRILGLTKDDFILEEDGLAHPILRLTPPTTTMNVLLMFDHNLTWLKDTPEGDGVDVRGMWNNLLLASMGFLARLRPSDRIAAATFEDKVQPALDWRSSQLGRQARANIGSVIQRPAAQKDLYGAIRWAVTGFVGAQGRKSLVIFTDGRDGRFTPIWFRDSKAREVIDPLFGIPNDSESAEFEEVLRLVRQSGIKIHFVVINSDSDPEFGPAIVGRRISGLYPGADEGIRDYLSHVRQRLERLAEVGGGRVLYGNTPLDAMALYADMHDELGVDRIYTLEFVSTKAWDGKYRHIEVRTVNPALRVSQYRAGYTAR